MHEINLDLKNKKNPQSSMIADNLVIPITIPWNEAQAAYQRALQKTAAKMKTDGFRRGKIPTSLVETQVGKAYLIEEAINLVLPQKYSEAVVASGKKIIAYPEFKPLSIEWGKDWTLEAHTAEAPKIKLGDYKKIIKKGQAEAAKEIKKIEDEAKKSAEKPSKDSKSKDAKSSAPKLPTMSDQAKKDKTLELIIKNLVTEIKPAIPEVLVKQQAHTELHRLEDQLKSINMTLPEYLEKRAVSEESVLQELAAGALAQLQTDFIMVALTSAEKFEASEEDITKQLGKSADKANDQLRQMVKTSIERQRLLDFLLAA